MESKSLICDKSVKCLCAYPLRWRLPLRKRATVGGGAGITKFVPARSLSMARGKQTNLANWARPKKLVE